MKKEKVDISFAFPANIYKDCDSVCDAEWAIRNYIEKTIMEDDPLNCIVSIKIK